MKWDISKIFLKKRDDDWSDLQKEEKKSKKTIWNDLQFYFIVVGVVAERFCHEIELILKEFENYQERRDLMDFHFVESEIFF